MRQILDKFLSFDAFSDGDLKPIQKTSTIINPDS